MKDKIVIESHDGKAKFEDLIKLLAIIDKLLKKIASKTKLEFKVFLEEKGISGSRCQHAFTVINDMTVECLKCRSQFSLTKRVFRKGGK